MVYISPLPTGIPGSLQSIKDIKDRTNKIKNQNQGKKKANILTTRANIVVTED